jgi:tRNA(Ile)-lysidine synthase
MKVMDSLIATVRAALNGAIMAAGLTGDDGPLVVAVSGGPDSLVLLDVLTRLYPAQRLIVAHLDHGLRPTSADDAAAVAQEASARDLRYVGERVAVGEAGRPTGLSLEAAARATRYDFLARAARAAGAAAVVVGHHADDQAETILLHLLRGAGLGGLRGMSAAAPLPGSPDLWLLRPLLGVERATIEAYCAAAGLRPTYDASNSDPTFTRNRLRHELLPLLATYNPRITQQLRETGAIAAAEDALLTALAEVAWGEIALPSPVGQAALRREEWRRQPLALRRRLLRRAVAACRLTATDVGFQAIEAARRTAEGAASGGRVSLPGGVVMNVGYEALIFYRGTTEQGNDWPQLAAPAPLAVPVPGIVALAGGWRLTAEALPHPDLDAIAANADPWTAAVALDPHTTLVVRPRAPGERIRPLGLGGATRLKEVMIDRRIPAAARALWPLVATAEHPVWLPGHVLDDRARVGPDSARVVRLHCASDSE